MHAFITCTDRMALIELPLFLDGIVRSITASSNEFFFFWGGGAVKFGLIGRSFFHHFPQNYTYLAEYI